MSEYTMYSIIHTNDILKAKEKLTRSGITSVLLVDFDHPLYDFKNVNRLSKEWKKLPFKNQWLVFMNNRQYDRECSLFDKSIYLMIDETPSRWFLGLYQRENSLEYLFSDQPWDDACDPDPQKDIDRINRSKQINTIDIKFMENFFQLPQSFFVDFLCIGQVYSFAEAVGIPAIEMLCDWKFYYPEQCQGRCMLWDEYE